MHDPLPDADWCSLSDYFLMISMIILMRTRRPIIYSIFDSIIIFAWCCFVDIYFADMLFVCHDDDFDRCLFCSIIIPLLIAFWYADDVLMYDAVCLMTIFLMFFWCSTFWLKISLIWWCLIMPDPVCFAWLICHYSIFDPDSDMILFRCFFWSCFDLFIIIISMHPTWYWCLMILLWCWLFWLYYLWRLTMLMFDVLPDYLWWWRIIVRSLILMPVLWCSDVCVLTMFRLFVWRLFWCLYLLIFDKCSAMSLWYLFLSMIVSMPDPFDLMPFDDILIAWWCLMFWFCSVLRSAVLILFFIYYFDVWCPLFHYYYVLICLIFVLMPDAAWWSWYAWFSVLPMLDFIHLRWSDYSFHIHFDAMLILISDDFSFSPFCLPPDYYSLLFIHFLHYSLFDYSFSFDFFYFIISLFSMPDYSFFHYYSFISLPFILFSLIISLPFIIRLHYYYWLFLRLFIISSFHSRLFAFCSFSPLLPFIILFIISLFWCWYLLFCLLCSCLIIFVRLMFCLLMSDILMSMIFSIIIIHYPLTDYFSLFIIIHYLFFISMLSLLFIDYYYSADTLLLIHYFLISFSSIFDYFQTWCLILFMSTVLSMLFYYARCLIRLIIFFDTTFVDLVLFSLFSPFRPLCHDVAWYFVSLILLFPLCSIWSDMFRCLFYYLWSCLFTWYAQDYAWYAAFAAPDDDIDDVLIYVLLLFRYFIHYYYYFILFYYFSLSSISLIFVIISIHACHIMIFLLCSFDYYSIIRLNYFDPLFYYLPDARSFRLFVPFILHYFDTVLSPAWWCRCDFLIFWFVRWYYACRLMPAFRSMQPCLLICRCPWYFDAAVLLIIAVDVLFCWWWSVLLILMLLFRLKIDMMMFRYLILIMFAYVLCLILMPDTSPLIFWCLICLMLCLTRWWSCLMMFWWCFIFSLICLPTTDYVRWCLFVLLIWRLMSFDYSDILMLILILILYSMFLLTLIAFLILPDFDYSFRFDYFDPPILIPFAHFRFIFDFDWCLARYSIWYFDVSFDVLLIHYFWFFPWLFVLMIVLFPIIIIICWSVWSDYFTWLLLFAIILIHTCWCRLLILYAIWCHIICLLPDPFWCWCDAIIISRYYSFLLDIMLDAYYYLMFCFDLLLPASLFMPCWYYLFCSYADPDDPVSIRCWWFLLSYLLFMLLLFLPDAYYYWSCLFWWKMFVLIILMPQNLLCAGYTFLSLFFTLISMILMFIRTFIIRCLLFYAFWYARMPFDVADVLR